MYNADLRMRETIVLEVEQGLLPPEVTTRLGYAWGPVVRNPAFASLWPEMSGVIGPSLRRLIEGSTPQAERLVYRVDLEAPRDTTILANRQ